MIKKICAIVVLHAACTCICMASGQESTGTENLEKKAGTLTDAAHDAIRKGCAFLRACQGKDGAWGSHDPVVSDSAQLAFGMNDFGCHDGVRIACTAICAKALLLYPQQTREDTLVLQKAIQCLLRDWRLAYDPGTAFNCWGYGYNLDFLLTLNAHKMGRPYEKAIKETVPKIIDGLRRMQVADGGWSYYTSVMMDGTSLSFTTATILLSLMKARGQGFKLPEGMIHDAGAIIKTQVLPNKNVIYGTHLKYVGSHALEDLSCCGRNQVCGLALHLFDGFFTRKDLLHASNHFLKTIDYIEVTGNKRLIPHKDAPQNISGYFLYYGCYYAGEVLAQLGDEAPDENWEHLARLILQHQEPEGGWWDTIFYDYGDKYGTGFALLCLIHYLESQKALSLKLN
ncbi:MAG: prenyltransferase/squalene oxidase repeat-containing protein [Planctomycetota bacterium]